MMFKMCACLSFSYICVEHWWRLLSWFDVLKHVVTSCCIVRILLQMPTDYHVATFLLIKFKHSSVIVVICSSFVILVTCCLVSWRAKWKGHWAEGAVCCVLGLFQFITCCILKGLNWSRVQIYKRSATLWLVGNRAQEACRSSLRWWIQLCRQSDRMCAVRWHLYGLKSRLFWRSRHAVIAVINKL